MNVKRFPRGITPLHMQIILHYYCQPFLPYSADNPGHAYSIATLQYTEELWRAGLLKANASGYDTTQKGRDYIELTLNAAHAIAVNLAREES